MSKRKPLASQILVGDCRAMLRTLPAGCARTCVTSPPYYGLRDYGVDGQIGLEESPDVFVATLVDVFREVRRVLADDGTLWLNLGDSYASSAGGYSDDGSRGATSNTRIGRGTQAAVVAHRGRKPPLGLKPKDLIGIPWMVAFALRADGWYLRSDIVWAKPNPMPESVTDRPTKSHEYLFLLSKSSSYFYDADAIKEPSTWPGQGRSDIGPLASAMPGAPLHRGIRGLDVDPPADRNKRSVWTVATQPYDGAHFATFPPKLIEPCILAGSAVGDLVVDPFFGSGTTGMVAEKHGRRWIGIDINPAYAKLAEQRTSQRSFMLPTKESA